MKYMEIQAGVGIIGVMVDFNNFGNNFQYQKMANLDTGFYVPIYKNKNKKIKKTVDKNKKS